MKRDTLRRVIELRQRARDGAAAASAQAARTRDEAAGTLAMLEQHRGELDRRSPKTGERATDGRAIDVHERFATRLDGAIAEQGRVLAQLDTLAQARERALIEHQSRLRAVERLAQRRAADDDLRRLRREQALTDEVAQRHARPANATGSSPTAANGGLTPPAPRPSADDA